MCSLSSDSASESNNEQTHDGTQNVAFFSEKLPRTADDAGSGYEAQYLTGMEGAALPRPAWMDASSQDSSIADARVQSIRDIIRVSDCSFM